MKASSTVIESHRTADGVDIWITDRIEADYVRRGVFPTIRRELAKSESCAKRRYRVAEDVAKAIYEDAIDMNRIRREGKTGKGLSLAYRLTIDRLSWLREDPPQRTVPISSPQDVLRVCRELQEAERQGCALPVGTKVLYFDGEGDEGRAGVITKRFAHHKVGHADGDFTDTDGSRFVYRPGYVVELDDGDGGFVPAHSISRIEDCKPTHLRLAWVASDRRRSA